MGTQQVAFEARVSPFRTPERSLGDLKADYAASVVALATDLALVIDRNGVIQDLTWSNDDLGDEDCGRWLGRTWSDIVTVESRGKVAELLDDAARRRSTGWRQVNHPSVRGMDDLPVRYAAIRLNDDGRILALGREMRSLTLVQQRLVNAQQSLEREYARLRQAETRYRLLFQLTSEAVLIVDAATRRINDANPAAAHLLGATPREMLGEAFPETFQPESVDAIAAMLDAVRTGGRGYDVRARLKPEKSSFLISASLMRQDDAAFFLVRLAPVLAVEAAVATDGPQSRLADVIERMPEGFVVTELDRRIITANASFLDMAQLASEDQARGHNLERWLGRSRVDFNVLASILREHGSVRLFPTLVRGEFGATEEVEVSSVAVANNDRPCFGFSIRRALRSPAPEGVRGHQLPRSAEQFTELIGRVPLKDLVRETTDLIERLCIEAALELTGDNRASAAEMLGLSRQSLYVKLRRYGMADPPNSPGDFEKTDLS